MSQELGAYGILTKKRDGKKLKSEEIKWFISNYLDDKVADYQMSAFLTSAFINGLDKEETAALTDCMLYSGEVIDFADDTDLVIDKHSTGGVGDKTSFILAPIAAACGVKVPMIAGRGLGHTGGTVDKIEAINGFDTSLSLKEFRSRVLRDGIVMIGQTKDIAPADKRIYGLRDVTATVESIPLITASIMSKKLAEGARGMVMDVKSGRGAFMKTVDEAKLLAESLRETALRFDRHIITMITDMDQPLGEAIGNSNEIIESLEILKGRGPADLRTLSLALAGGMVYLANLASSLEEGIEKASEALSSGKALEVFRQLVIDQKGDPRFVDDYSHFPMAEEEFVVKAPRDGYVSSINVLNLGLYCADLGGGRKKVDDIIDFGVGLYCPIKIGQKVEKGQTLIRIKHHRDQKELVNRISTKLIEEDIVFSSESCPEKKLIIDTQTSWSK